MAEADYGGMVSHYRTAPEKALEEAKTEFTPLGERHLHYIVGRNPGHWVVRTKRGPLCGTPRCRLVMILERGRRGDDIKVEVVLTGPDREKEQFDTEPEVHLGISFGQGKSQPVEGYREF